MGGSEMGDDVMVKLRIHYGGSMWKEIKEYKYVEQLGCLIVKWKLSEIKWEMFGNLITEDLKIITPIRSIWYKEVGKEMNTVDYVLDETYLLCLAAKAAGGLDVFIEYECSDHVVGMVDSYLLIGQQDEDDTAGRYEGGEDDISGGYEAGKEDGELNEDDVDRPKEDEEADESEDELNKQDNVAENQGDAPVLKKTDEGMRLS